MKKYNIDAELLSILADHVEAGAKEKVICVDLDIKTAASNEVLSRADQIRQDAAERKYARYRSYFIHCFAAANRAWTVEEISTFWSRVQSAYERIASGQLSAENAILDVVDMTSDYTDEARDFCNALRFFAAHPENIDNFEGYLARHFASWAVKYASTPEGLTSEMLNFATMGVQGND